MTSVVLLSPARGAIAPVKCRAFGRASLQVMMMEKYAMQGAKDKAMKPSIVITELPYQTNKSAFVADVARLVEEQKLTGACSFPSTMFESSQEVLCT